MKLKDDLEKLFEARKHIHQFRARKAQKIADLAFDDVWCVNKQFANEYGVLVCPLCQKRSLAEQLDTLQLCHWQNIKRSGNTLGAVFFACRVCNQRLWNCCKDEIECWCQRTGINESDFRHKVSMGLNERIDQQLQELERFENQPLVNRAMVALALGLADLAEQSQKSQHGTKDRPLA